MKRIGYLIGCLLLAVTSCNDDDSPAPPAEESTFLLKKVSRNGITHIELFYDADKTLYRLDYYFGATFANYTLYDYNDTGLKELRRYAADDHTLEYRSVYTLDNYGRIIKGENYGGPDFSKVSSINQYTYDASGRLIKKEFRLPDNPIYSRQEYTYDDQNNLIKVQNMVYPTQPNKYMSYQEDFVPGEIPPPDAWASCLSVLSLSELDNRIFEMFYDGYHVQQWDSDQEIFSESSIEPSDRTFDSHGNLIRQVLTYKNILKPQNPDVVSELTYEYID